VGRNLWNTVAVDVHLYGKPNSPEFGFSRLRNGRYLILHDAKTRINPMLIRIARPDIEKDPATG
jgi:hypothetical protein